MGRHLVFTFVGTLRLILRRAHHEASGRYHDHLGTLRAVLELLVSPAAALRCCPWTCADTTRLRPSRIRKCQRMSRSSATRSKLTASSHHWFRFAQPPVWPRSQFGCEKVSSADGALSHASCVFRGRSFTPLPRRGARRAGRAPSTASTAPSPAGPCRQWSAGAVGVMRNRSLPRGTVG